MIDFHIHSDYSDGDQTIEEIVLTAKRRKLEAIAISDHIDSNGKFMYLRHTGSPKRLDEYIKEIRAVAKRMNYPIYASAEISDFSNYTVLLSNEFKNLDFILIETQKPRGPTNPLFDPIKRASFIKNQFKNIPVGLAHPEIEFIEKNIERFQEFDIFIELNGDKLTRNYSDLNGIFHKIKNLLMDYPEIKISVGSDAHQIYMIGGVKRIWEFIISNGLTERLLINFL
ncbi:MAG: PHP domain-containing protein [Candidatus Helarchaeota archaeon]